MRRALLAAFAVAAPAFADDAPGLVVTGRGGTVTIAPEAFAKLPVRQVSLAEHGSERAFEGPLLWTVLSEAGVIDPTKAREQVRRVVLVTASDGYTAVLALGEIAPEFENKPVILAERAGGAELGFGHWHLVVPGDGRAARSARDVIKLTVLDPASP